MAANINCRLGPEMNAVVDNNCAQDYWSVRDDHRAWRIPFAIYKQAISPSEVLESVRRTTLGRRSVDRCALALFINKFD